MIYLLHIFGKIVPISSASHNSISSRTAVSVLGSQTTGSQLHLGIQPYLLHSAGHFKIKSDHDLNLKRSKAIPLILLTANPKPQQYQQQSTGNQYKSAIKRHH